MPRRNKRIAHWGLRIGAAFVCAGVIGGCAASHGAASARQAGAARGFAARDSAIRSLRGYGTIYVSSPELKQSASIDVSLRDPDSLRIVLTGPFGIPLGTAFATKKSYVVYNALENTVKKGSFDSTRELPLPGFVVTFDDAYRFLKGCPPAFTTRADSMPMNGEVRGVDSGGRTVECLLGEGCVKKARIEQPDGDDILEAFSDYTPVDGIDFPFHLTADSRRDGKMSIRYSDITLNTQGLDFSITIPSSARIIGAK